LRDLPFALRLTDKKKSPKTLGFRALIERLMGVTEFYPSYACRFRQLNGAGKQRLGGTWLKILIQNIIQP